MLTFKSIHWQNALAFALLTILTFGVAPITSGYANASHQQADGKTADPLPQWKTLQQQHLTKKGDKILSLLEDAESCLPYPNDSDLLERERILLSDLLKCASETNMAVLGPAVCEFARTHQRPDVLLHFLDPLIYTNGMREKRLRFGPWDDMGGRLRLREGWNKGLFRGHTGVVYFRILQMPTPKGPRENITEFSNQISAATSRWHL